MEFIFSVSLKEGAIAYPASRFGSFAKVNILCCSTQKTHSSNSCPKYHGRYPEFEMLALNLELPSLSFAQGGRYTMCSLYPVRRGHGKSAVCHRRKTMFLSKPAFHPTPEVRRFGTGFSLVLLGLSGLWKMLCPFF